jgi:hypothetical protein
LIELLKIGLAPQRVSTCRLISLFVMLTVVGCGGSQPSNNPPPPLNGQIYVTKANFSTFLRFRAGDSGDVAPQAQRQIGPWEQTTAAFDVINDRLAAAGNGSSVPSITLIDNASAGLCCNQPRIISGTATTFFGVGTPALDGKHDLLYVVNFPPFSAPPVILVFGPASTISGNVAPLRTITTTTPSVGAIALDSGNDRLFGLTNGSVVVFDNASTLNGAVVPNRVISGSATQISQPFDFALDSTGSLLVVDAGPRTAPVHILVFNNAGTANGNVAPVASATLAIPPFQMAVSPDGQLYVVDGNPAIAVYSNITIASGNLAPARVIAGPNTNLEGGKAIPPFIAGVAVDPTR